MTARLKDRLVIITAIIWLGLIVALCGCKVTTFRYVTTDGRVITASDTRFLVNTRATIVFTHGTNFALSVKTASNPDNEAIAAIAEGAVRGAKGL